MQTMEQTMKTRLNAAKCRRTAHALRVRRYSSAYRMDMTIDAPLCGGVGDVALIEAGQTLM